jgi:hypothetical protein
MRSKVRIERQQNGCIHLTRVQYSSPKDMSKIIILLCGNKVTLRQVIDAEWEKSDYTFFEIEIPENMVNQLIHLMTHTSSESQFWRIVDLVYNLFHNNILHNPS